MLPLQRVGVLLTTLALGLGAQAQNLYQLHFKGTSSTLDSSGKEVVTRITDKTLIHDWAAKVGASDFRNLILVLHRDVDSRGDTIEVVNKKTKEWVTTAFPLFFPESTSITTPKGTIEKRFAYVYNLNHSEFSRGTAIMDQQTVVNKKGQTNRFVVKAEMQWYEVPEGTNGFRINSGTFKAGKQLK